MGGGGGTNIPLPPQSKKWGGGAHAPLAPPLPTPVHIENNYTPLTITITAASTEMLGTVYTFSTDD